MGKVIKINFKKKSNVIEFPKKRPSFFDDFENGPMIFLKWEEAVEERNFQEMKEIAKKDLSRVRGNRLMKDLQKEFDYFNFAVENDYGIKDLEYFCQKRKLPLKDLSTQMMNVNDQDLTDINKNILKKEDNKVIKLEDYKRSTNG
tara:strand:- start:10064 stop:10498 length:435 start_codon:yes stop_codon:yes gene_type:complete